MAAAPGALLYALLALSLIHRYSHASATPPDRRFSELKRCADPECSKLMCRGKAAEDFTGPDCRFVNFKKDEIIYVYHKLHGRSDEVWAGSVGTGFGYFPKDLVDIKQVYTEDELEMPTDETDFVCFEDGADKFDSYDVKELLSKAIIGRKSKPPTPENTPASESETPPTEQSLSETKETPEEPVPSEIKEPSGESPPSETEEATKEESPSEAVVAPQEPSPSETQEPAGESSPPESGEPTKEELPSETIPSQEPSHSETQEPPGESPPSESREATKEETPLEVAVPSQDPSPSEILPGESPPPESREPRKEESPSEAAVPSQELSPSEIQELLRESLPPESGEPRKEELPSEAAVPSQDPSLSETQQPAGESPSESGEPTKESPSETTAPLEELSPSETKEPSETSSPSDASRRSEELSASESEIQAGDQPAPASSSHASAPEELSLSALEPAATEPASEKLTREIPSPDSGTLQENDGQPQSVNSQATDSQEKVVAEENATPESQVPESEQAKNVSISQGGANKSKEKNENIESYTLLEDGIQILKTEIGSTSDAVVSDDVETRHVTRHAKYQDEDKEDEPFELEEEEEPAELRLLPYEESAKNSLNQVPFENESDSTIKSEAKMSPSEEEVKVPIDVGRATPVKQEKSILTSLGDTIFAIVSGGDHTDDVTDPDEIDSEEQEEDDDAEEDLDEKERLYLLGMEQNGMRHNKRLEPPFDEDLVLSEEDLLHETLSDAEKDKNVETESKINVTNSSLEDTTDLPSVNETAPDQINTDSESTQVEPDNKGESEEPILTFEIKELDDDEILASPHHEQEKTEDVELDETEIKREDVAENVKPTSAPINADLPMEGENSQVQSPDPEVKETEISNSEAIENVEEKTEEDGKPEELAETLPAGEDGTSEGESTVQSAPEINGTNKTDEKLETTEQNQNEESIINDAGGKLQEEASQSNQALEDKPALDIESSPASGNEEDEYTDGLLEDENAASAKRSQELLGNTANESTDTESLLNTEESNGSVLDEKEIEQQFKNVEKENKDPNIQSAQHSVKQNEDVAETKEEKGEEPAAVTEDTAQNHLDISNTKLDVLEAENEFATQEVESEADVVKEDVNEDLSDKTSDNMAGKESGIIGEDPEEKSEDPYSSAPEDASYIEGIKALAIMRTYLQEERIAQFVKYLDPDNVMRLEAMFQDMDSELKLARRDSVRLDYLDKALDQILEASESNILDFVESVLDAREIDEEEIVATENEMFDEESALLDDVQEISYKLRQKHSAFSDSSVLAEEVETTETQLPGEKVVEATEKQPPAEEVVDIRETQLTEGEVVEAKETQPTKEEVMETTETQPAGENIVETTETQPSEEKVVEATETQSAEEKVVETTETQPAEEKVVEATETQPSEEKVVEATETQSAEEKVVETTETQSAEEKVVETTETQPAEEKVVEATETQSTEEEIVETTETQPTEEEIVETTETQPTEEVATKTEPTEEEATETQPTEEEVVEATETQPTEEEAIETEPTEEEAIETEPTEEEATDTQPKEEVVETTETQLTKEEELENTVTPPLAEAMENKMPEEMVEEPIETQTSKKEFVEQPPEMQEVETKVVIPNQDPQEQKEELTQNAEETITDFVGGEEAGESQLSAVENAMHTAKISLVPVANLKSITLSPVSSLVRAIMDEMEQEDPVSSSPSLGMGAEPDFLVTLPTLSSLLPSRFLQLVSALPEDLQPGPDFHGVQWEAVLVTFVVGLMSILIFCWRTCLSVKSRLYQVSEKQLAEKIASLMKEKSEALEQISELEKKMKETKESESTSHERSTQLQEEAANLKAAIKDLKNSNKQLDAKMRNLMQELDSQKEQSKRKQEMIYEGQKSIERLTEQFEQHSAELSELQIALNEAKMKEQKVRLNLHGVQEENSSLKERKEQLLKEAEGWSERQRELEEQIQLQQKSHKDLEEALAYKENEIEVLTNCIMQLKQLEEDSVSREDGGWQATGDGEMENGELPDKRKEKMKLQIKQMMDVSRVKTTLSIIEEEKELYQRKLNDEISARHELEEQIKQIQHDSSSLQSERTRLDNECKTLRQKVEILTELYQQKEMALQKKLTQEEYERQEKELKLTSADEKAILAVEEVKIYKQRIQEMEEELQKTERSYKNQISSHEKKAHENWLIARTAERTLAEEKRECSNLRQKLIEVNQRIAALQRPSIVKPTPGRPEHQAPPRRGTLSRDGSFGPSPVSGGAPSPPVMMDVSLRSASANFSRTEDSKGNLSGGDPPSGTRRPSHDMSGRTSAPVDLGHSAMLNSGPRTSSPSVDGLVMPVAKGPPSFPGTPVMNSPAGAPMMSQPPGRMGGPPPFRGPLASRSLPPSQMPGPPPRPLLPPGGIPPPDPRGLIRGPFPPGPVPLHGPRDYPGPPPGARDIPPGLPPSGPRDFPPGPMPPLPRDLPPGPPPPGVSFHPGPPPPGARDFPPGLPPPGAREFPPGPIPPGMRDFPPGPLPPGVRDIPPGLPPPGARDFPPILPRPGSREFAPGLPPPGMRDFLPGPPPDFREFPPGPPPPGARDFPPGPPPPGVRDFPLGPHPGVPGPLLPDQRPIRPPHRPPSQTDHEQSRGRSKP
ncbi:transport and Golgi organization protein 1 homolog [Gastrophryne carolinensis]